MSVQNVQLISQESERADGVLTASRVYHVEVELGDDSETARLATGIPSEGDLFKAGSTAKVKSVRARNLDTDQLTYEVQVDYTSQKQEQVEEAGDNPLEEPAKLSYGGSVVTENFFRDMSEAPDDWDTEGDGPWKGKPVVTSAGEDFQSLPERERAIGTLTITKNYATYNDVNAESYKNTVNDDNITIGGVTYTTGTLRMRNITAEGPNSVTIPDGEGGTTTVTYYTVTYDIAKSIHGHDLELEDRGTHELSVNGKLKPILGLDAQQVATPYPLDGEGHSKESPTAHPAVLTFVPYVKKDWSPLGLADD